MHVELASVIGFAGSLLAFGVSVYMAILRYALSQKEHEIERRFHEVEKKHEDSDKGCAYELKKLGDRLAIEEKETVRLTGNIQLVQNNHDALTRDLEEIKRNMITKAEFEPRMSNLERTLNQILAELRGGRSRSYGEMPAVTGPKRGG